MLWATKLKAPTSVPGGVTPLWAASAVSDIEEDLMSLRSFIGITSLAVLTACSQQNEPAATNGAADALAVVESGEELAKRSGCHACHAVQQKVVGPRWQDVAERYKDDPNARKFLIKKVREGGKGSWKEVTGGITMPPYSPRVKNEDIEKLVDYILSLAKSTP
jgi:cytochrome c